MSEFKHIHKTTLLLNSERISTNISQMLRKSNEASIIFRPHFKTHQSIEVAKLFAIQGIDKITVSSVDMAIEFADHGWKDILIAIPFNIRECEEVNAIPEDVSISLAVENETTVVELARRITRSIDIYIKIDCGYGRTGLEVNDTLQISSIADAVSSFEKLKLKGLLSHFGNTYSANSEREVIEIFNQALQSLTLLKEELEEKFGNLMVSIGDTPSLSMIDKWEGFDEARPGNFVLYDYMQYKIGSCRLEQIAAIVACPIIAIYPERNEVIIHAGAVHLSKESIDDKGDMHYGRLVDMRNGFNTEILKQSYVRRVSQEHGTLFMPSDLLAKFQIGDLIGVVPIHSCLTANLLQKHTIII